MDKIVEEHLSPRWRRWLEKRRLADFEAWWRLELADVDPPNYDRAGWSTVASFETDGRRFFVKRQSDYLCRHLTSPLFAVPTARAEHRMIDWCRRSGIPALDEVYFGWRQSSGEQQAILVTEALTGFSCLSDLSTSAAGPTSSQRRALARSIGRAVAKLHRSGMRHSSLYPKHVFVRPTGDGWEVRFIDLENTRPHFWHRGAKLRDLESLSRRSRGWSRADKLRVLLAYFGKTRVDAGVRAAVARIRAGTQHKRRRR